MSCGTVDKTQALGRAAVLTFQAVELAGFVSGKGEEATRTGRCCDASGFLPRLRVEGILTRHSRAKCLWTRVCLLGEDRGKFKWNDLSLASGFAKQNVFLLCASATLPREMPTSEASLPRPDRFWHERANSLGRGSGVAEQSKQARAPV